jgi:hypothetical protein
MRLASGRVQRGRLTSALLLLVTSSAVWNCGGRSPIEAYGKDGTLGLGGSKGSSGAGGSQVSAGEGGSSPGYGKCTGLLCHDVCINDRFDPENCGACDSVCAEGEVCYERSCSVGCGEGTEQCGDRCVDTEIDPNHCGACDDACGAGQTCSGGVCGESCDGALSACNGSCVDLELDPYNCGSCGFACADAEFCSVGECGASCVGGTTPCGDLCVDNENDPEHCGNCSTICGEGLLCSQGECSATCSGGTTQCGEICVDTNVDPNNCGECGEQCAESEVCSQGECASVCGGDLEKCGDVCVDNQTHPAHCGDCEIVCGPGQDCIDGECKDCDSSVEDCDNDDWFVADGDCCDKPGGCGNDPSLVNPGALEVLGNGADDDCNGKIDLFDSEILEQCDSAIASDTSDSFDYARAMGICRFTEEQPADPMQRTWGLIDAQLLRADGSPLEDARARSTRQNFGSISATQGEVMAVLSTGIASDASQTNPGPNGGAPLGNNVSVGHAPDSSVDIENCSHPYCLEDWYGTANPPLKLATRLPRAPDCGTDVAAPTANDSVMLVLRMRAPTNVRAFSFNSYFLSAEYPEYVCSAFNDQFVALVDTPAGAPAPIPNPIDKNLLVYTQGGELWPIGINIAKGTSLFSVCPPQAGNSCWSTWVNASSCSLGADSLIGTGFETPDGFEPGCSVGGGTHWLTTAGNVVPGTIVELRIVIWDVGDNAFDSVALIDGFQWLPSATLPGTN